MTTSLIDVVDAHGATQAIPQPNPNGRAPAADSRPIALSAEDKAALDILVSSILQTNGFGRQVITGSRDKWRDDFTGPTLDPLSWTPSIDANDKTRFDGGGYGSSFLCLTKSGLVPYTESSILGKKTFNLPARVGFGLSVSQRIDGEMHLVELVEVDPTTGALVLDGSGDNQTFNPSDIMTAAIVNVVVASNVATIYLNADHPYKVDDMLVLWNNTNNEINGLVRVTQVVNRRAVVGALTAANATYTGGGNIARIDLSAGVRNVASLAIYGTTTANAAFVVKGQGSSEFQSAQTSFGTSWSDALVPAAQNWLVNLQPRFNTDIIPTLDSCKFGSTTTDSATAGSFAKRSQDLPNPSATYAVRIRSINLPNKSVPLDVVTAVKTASSTATVTTATAHGFVTGQKVKAYGAFDQTNWANVTTETAVTVLNSTQFTLTWGASTTATIYGGVIVPSQANGTTGVNTNNVRGSTWRNGRLWVATNSSASFTIGDTIRLVGCRESSGAGLRANVNQRYRVIAINPNICETAALASGTATNGSATLALTDTAAVPVGALLTGTGFAAIAVNAVTAGVSLTMASNASAGGTSAYTMYGLVLEPLDASAPADSQPTAALSGGAIVKETDLRLNFIRCLDHTRTPVEVVSGFSSGDESLSVPAKIYGTTSISGTVTGNQGSRGTVGSGWYVEPDNLLVNDVASAAITTTTTTSAITPTPVGGAAQFNIPVTVVSGTSPTMDVSIEESDDTGTNWYPIYRFPRITATGMYRSPLIPLSGNRIRYVQTIGGTSPSFTRAINRIAHQMVTPPLFRQIIDRTVVLTTLNSTTPSLQTNGANNHQLVWNVGAITTTAPQMQIEGSDDNGATWYSIGTPLTAVASSTVQLTVSGITAQMIRGRISTAGVGVTAGHVTLKSYGV